MGSVGGAEGTVGMACGVVRAGEGSGAAEPEGTADVGRGGATIDERGTLLSSSNPGNGCRL